MICNYIVYKFILLFRDSLFKAAHSFLMIFRSWSCLRIIARAMTKFHRDSTCVCYFGFGSIFSPRTSWTFELFNNRVICVLFRYFLMARLNTRKSFTETFYLIFFWCYSCHQSWKKFLNLIFISMYLLPYSFKLFYQLDYLISIRYWNYYLFVCLA